MKTTVVTIAYNDREGVRRTVESVRAQEGVNLEHVVVDAASSDGTAQWLAEQPVSDSFHWVSEPDRGRYDGMNKGVALGTGDLLWFMHSSDVFATPTSARTAVDHLEYTGARWGYGMSIIVVDGEVIGSSGQPPFRRSDLLTGIRTIPHQATLFRTNFFRELGGYDTEFGLTADQLFMMVAAERENPTTIPAVLCVFDGKGAGSTRGLRHHLRDTRRARRSLGASMTGSTVLDEVLGVLALVETASSRLRRRLHRPL